MIAALVVIALLMLYLVWALLSLRRLWIYYLAVMSLERINDENPLDGVAKIFGNEVLYSGLFLDVRVNIFVMTVLLLEWPREWLVTARLSRLIDDDGWRGDVARWACATLLDQFDPRGCHCKKQS